MEGIGRVGGRCKRPSTRFFWSRQALHTPFFSATFLSGRDLVVHLKGFGDTRDPEFPKSRASQSVSRIPRKQLATGIGFSEDARRSRARHRSPGGSAFGCDPSHTQRCCAEFQENSLMLARRGKWNAMNSVLRYLIRLNRPLASCAIRECLRDLVRVVDLKRVVASRCRRHNPATPDEAATQGAGE